MKKQRKHYTPEEKVAILRRHLVEGVPISDLCEERDSSAFWTATAVSWFSGICASQ
jgi:transposase-like protein